MGAMNGVSKIGKINDPIDLNETDVRYVKQPAVHVGIQTIEVVPTVCSNRTRIHSVVWWPEYLATDPEVRVRFPALQDFLRSSGSGTGSSQPREYNRGAT
jgi:hypothetical protein